MAKTRRGYSPLVLDGRRFRWACEFHYPFEIMSAGYARNGSTWRPDTLVIRPEDRPQRLLTVTWPACCGPLVKPGVVRACIEEALRREWLGDYSVMKLAGCDVPTGDTNNAEPGPVAQPHD
jgi:hypothetical protein